MRIANATDLYGNPYLTSVTAADVVNAAVDSAVEEAIGSSVGSMVDSAVAEAVPGAVESAIGSSVDSAVSAAVDSAVESAGFVRDSELPGKIESMGSSITTALDSEGYLDSCIKEDNLASKLEELGFVPGGSATVPSEKIEFTSADSEKVAWTDNVATFTHGLNGMPAVVLFDGEAKQVLAEVVYLNASSFSIDFGDKTQVTGTWTAVVYRAADPAAPVEP